MRFPFIKPATAFLIFRAALGLMLAAHGFMRLYVNSVGGFGEFLNSKGFLIGPAIAWFLTIFDLVGGILMATGVFARWIAAIFMIEIGMGIILVHAQNGWFVVGHQSGGVEYSVLIILSLLMVAAWSGNILKREKNVQ
jgi:putative oxidoreductase